MNLKKFLKLLKLNESNISTILGVIVIIIAGIIAFNYFKNSSKMQIETSNSTSQEKNQLTAENQKYSVTAGDNLWKIAVKYYNNGYKWVDIAKENKLTDPNRIEKGLELIIPKVEKVATLSDSIEAKNPTIITNTNTITGGTYTVVKGDSLWSIAVRAYSDGYQWVKISRENKLLNPGNIHPGNVLSLPR